MIEMTAFILVEFQVGIIGSCNYVHKTLMMQYQENSSRELNNDF